MDIINRILIELPPEIRSSLYDGFGFCMHIVMLVFLAVQAKYASLNKKGILQLFVSYYVAFSAGNIACNVSNSLTDGLIPRINLGVAFLVFLLVLILLLRLLKAPVCPFLDISVPVFLLGRAVGIIGCIFTGCCHGFFATWGIYSHQAKTTVVPTVLVDIASSCVIVFYLLLKRKKVSASGMIATKGILLFGVLRYVVDVLRDNQKQFGFLTAEGICGALYVLIGFVLLFIIDNKQQIKSALHLGRAN